MDMYWYNLEEINIKEELERDISIISNYKLLSKSMMDSQYKQSKVK